MRRRCVIAVVMGLGGLACSGSSPISESLVDHALWQEMSAGDDPFADRLPVVTCALGSFVDEGSGDAQAVEVDTSSCDYITLRQPSLADLEVGDDVKISVWHLTLTSALPALAHAAVRVGDTVVWENNIDIPADPKVYESTYNSTVAAPAGTPVYFHVHNHGANNWTFHELARTR